MQFNLALKKRIADMKKKSTGITIGERKFKC